MTWEFSFLGVSVSGFSATVADNVVPPRELGEAQARPASVSFADSGLTAHVCHAVPSHVGNTRNSVIAFAWL